MSESKNIADPTTGTRKLTKQGKTSVRKRAMQYEILQRRKEVKALRLKGWSPTELAEYFKVNLPTISKDLKAIREEQADSLTDMTRATAVAEARDRYDMIDREAWKTYDDAMKGSQTKAKLLDLVRLNNGDRIKAMVDTGVIQKEAAKVEITHHHQLDWSEEMRDKVAEALLEQTFKTPLLDPIPEEDPIVVPDVEDFETLEPTDDPVQTED